MFLSNSIHFIHSFSSSSCFPVDTDADADDDEGHIEEEKDINHHHDKVNQGDRDELGVNGDGKDSPEANDGVTVSLLRGGGRNVTLLANQ